MPINFTNTLNAFKRMKSSLPVKLGNKAKNFYRKGFKDGGFTDQALDPWAARKTKDKSDRRNPDKARAILVKTGHGRNSITCTVASFEQIEIKTVGITYLHYHNVGDTRDGVQRKVIAPSHVLFEEIKSDIRKEIDKFLGK